MKNIIIFFSALILVLIILIYSIAHEDDDRSYFTGYIPLNAKPVIVWDTVNTQHVSGKYLIDVIKDNGDSIKAGCPLEGMMLGEYLVKFHDTYPRAIGKKVYVKGYYTKGKNPYIEQAELYPLK